MGRILTTLTITNRLGQSTASRGFIPHPEVCSIALNQVLVDTGATTLCLLRDAIAQRVSTCSKDVLKEVDVATANGFRNARIF